ncbi:MAG: phytanoyl-CoA dioxygenase family protein [Nocardiopsaceae bacterium]|nr:phytanoyl-CoA dioxygenase family protein [Nocardiopsaceae bacterium]
MLSEGQLRQFGDQGYLVVPGVVPERLLEPVDAEVDALIAESPPPVATGNHAYFEPPGRLPAADAALRDSPAIGLAQALVSPLPVEHALDHIQVALNIPPHPHRPGGPHLDGHRPGQARPYSFTMLAGIYLVDESAPDSGNLWVWPGSHLVHEQLFREQGVTALLATSGHTTSLAAPPRYGEPVQVLANRGDLLLAHFLLGHNIGGNTSNRLRRIVYYRLSCQDHTSRWSDTFTAPFTEYEPVRQALGCP